MVRRLIGSGITNAQGIAVMSKDANGNPITGYTGTGAGKLQILAVSNGVESEIKTIYDVLFKDIGTSEDYTNWRPSTTVDISRGTHVIITPKDSTVFGSIAVNLPNGANCIEFDVNINVNTAFISLRQNTTAVTSLSNEYIGITNRLGEWIHIQIEWDENNQYRAIVDGVKKEYRTFSAVPNRFQFSINENTGLEINYKNFIMYPR
jgi:hypothetical protein